jgi:hypothetical protein
VNNLDDGETASVVMTFIASGRPMPTPVGETEVRDRLRRRVSRTEPATEQISDARDAG